MTEKDILLQTITLQCQGVPITKLREINFILAEAIVGINAKAEDVLAIPPEKHKAISGESEIDLAKRLRAAKGIASDIKVDDLTFETLTDVAKHYRIDYTKLYYRVEKKNMNVEVAVKQIKNEGNIPF